MSEECSPSVRSLYAWEIQEAQIVFGFQLLYEKVRIHECVKWPNTINRVGLFLKRMPYVEVNNAITLGNHLHFPIRLQEERVTCEHKDFYKIAWLIHELTHAWQFQQMGWKYLIMALNTQIRAGAKAYDFGGEAGLITNHQTGRRLSDFNLEQQGDIARSYYEQVCRGNDTSAWQPYINDIQKVA